MTTPPSDGEKTGAGVWGAGPFIHDVMSQKKVFIMIQKDEVLDICAPSLEKAELETVFIKEFGIPPMTRKIAAAHEAGHVIVADAVGLPPIIHTYIHKKRIAGAQDMGLVDLPPVIWVGWTAWGNSIDNVFELSARELLQRLLFTLGGWGGERAIGQAHPASCVDERWAIAFQMAVFLYIRHHNPKGGVAYDKVITWALSLTARAEERALQIIRKRLHLFDRLRKRLYQCKRLEGDQLAPFCIGTMEGWDHDLIPLPTPAVH